MVKKHYKFNTDNLTYQEVELKLKDYLLKGIWYLLVGATFLIFGIIITWNLIDSPKEKEMARKYSELKEQVDLTINKKVAEMERQMDEIEERDTKTYRLILEADPYPDNLRKGGIGGVNRYRYIENYVDADLIISTNKRLDALKRRMYAQSKSFDEIIELALKKEEMLASIPAIQPVANKDLKRMASGYGMRIHPIYKRPKMHNGMDFTAATGTPIYATGNGTVVRAGVGSGFGNHVRISHGYGYLTLYAHMSRISVRKGQKVKRGQVIGYVGSTGLSTAPHLHYEVHQNGMPLNPVNYYFNDLSPAEYQRLVEISNNSNQSFD